MQDIDRKSGNYWTLSTQIRFSNLISTAANFKLTGKQELVLAQKSTPEASAIIDRDQFYIHSAVKGNKISQNSQGISRCLKQLKLDRGSEKQQLFNKPSSTILCSMSRKHWDPLPRCTKPHRKKSLITLQRFLIYLKAAFLPKTILSPLNLSYWQKINPLNAYDRYGVTLNACTRQ